MLFAGLGVGRKRLDLRVLDEAGETVEAGVAPRDADGLHCLALRVARFAEPVRAAIESMNSARFVHDRPAFGRARGRRASPGRCG
jgi:hypothetical protein